MGKLYEELRRKKTLHKAWRHVREAGLKSNSIETIRAIQEFDDASDTRLPSILRSLRRGSFRFDKARGIAVKKKSGSARRPLVVSSVRNRVVQRALLDIMQKHVAAVQSVLETPTSIGGIPKRGTSHAFVAITNELKAGKNFFIRSDISDFYTKIPKEPIHRFMKAALKDDALYRLFLAAVEVGLKNEEKLKRDGWLSIFPTSDIGFAQGSALSPLVGNIVLRGFDADLNDRGITCIRYVDDFVLMGRRKKDLTKAFLAARKMLQELGLDCYDPATHPLKAEEGDLNKGSLNFLGCEVTAGLIQPSKDARGRFMSALEGRINNGKKEIGNVLRSGSRTAKAKTYVRTLSDIEHLVNGWAHAFKFCNNQHIADQLDQEVSDRVTEFRQYVTRKVGTASPTLNLHILGIPAVSQIMA